MAYDLIQSNPKLKKPALIVLGVVERMKGAGREAVEDSCASAWPAPCVQSPAAVIDTLVREGCISEQITVDGISYAGTLEDAYRDPAVPNSAEVDAIMDMLPAGTDLLAAYDAAHTIRRLLEGKPPYRPVFCAVIERCASADGADRSTLEGEIERVVSEQGIRGMDGQRIYPQYFISALETAGAIEWTDAWHAMPAALEAIAGCAFDKTPDVDK